MWHTFNNISKIINPNIKSKNLIKRFIQIIKDRIECFDDYFPCLKEECDYEHIIKWIESFKIDYNYIRIHGKIGRGSLK